MRTATLRGRRQDGPETLAQRVYEGLREEITSGKLKPGERLTRRKIAANYGTSYMPVVEALVRLEGTGLIEVESAQTARVRTMTLETIEYSYVLREALETQSIRLACQFATDQEIEELHHLAAAVDQATLGLLDTGGGVSTPDVLQLDWQFHCRIAELSRCPFLVAELERIELMRRPQAVRIYVPVMAPGLPLHSRLVAAVKARDPLAADALMREHVHLGLEKERCAYRLQATRRET